MGDSQLELLRKAHCFFYEEKYCFKTNLIYGPYICLHWGTESELSGLRVAGKFLRRRFCITLYYYALQTNVLLISNS